MLSTAAHSLAAAIARLRSGVITRDYAPEPIADLIEALAREKRELVAHIEELERVSTPAAARNAYAAGWRDHQDHTTALLIERGYEDLAAEIAAAPPDLARAGRAAHEASV